jgi:putative hydrolase of the HAD superfamily
MGEIRAVFFDLGGVIVRTEDRQPRTALGARLGLSYDHMALAVFGPPPSPPIFGKNGGRESGGSAWRATLGEISEDEHWRNVVRALGLAEDELPQVRSAFFAGDRVDWGIVDFLRQLRKGGYRTGLISNAWSGLRPWIESQGFADAFDEMAISAEVAMGKPAPGIFQYALASLGAAPEESVFVDDMLANVEASRELGMHGVHFLSAEQALADVRRLLAIRAGK